MPEVAIVVPVMRRPQNAERFTKSLRESDADAEVFAVYDAEDAATREAWEAAGAWMVLAETGESYACKVNWAFQFVTTPWVFICGDDVIFDPEWFKPIRYIINRQPEIRVIGVPDGSGSTADFAPHFLLAADYVTERGASWDGPGVVCHEGYRHNYVDNEIIDVAKKRGVWHLCRTSLVEHLHPAWRKGEWDEVYKIGVDSAPADAALYERRMR